MKISIGQTSKNSIHQNSIATDVESSNTKNVIRKRSGTNHTSAGIAKHAWTSASKRAHRWIVVNVWSGKAKQRLHLISELFIPVRLVCVCVFGLCGNKDVQGVQFTQRAT